MSRRVTVHEDNKENIPCVTGVVWKITPVASGAVHMTCVCVCVNVCQGISPPLLTCLHTTRHSE